VRPRESPRYRLVEQHLEELLRHSVPSSTKPAASVNRGVNERTAEIA
jgi:hypothetical protein